ncbi:MAG: C2 domain-containing protein [Benniella sp.]|nr:MAG: C2 domain-containing protein [Benniella sp.]
MSAMSKKKARSHSTIRPFDHSTIRVIKLRKQCIHILAREAHGLKDVERFGSNDPYAQFTLDLADKQSFKKTSTKEGAGRNVEWNETIVLENYDPARHHNLYVDILDNEKLADEVIGYATIPLYQVTDAAGKSFKGKFDVFNDDGKQKGTIFLTISIIDSSEVGSNITNNGPEAEGLSNASEEQQKHIKKLKLKETAGDAAAAVAVGAALFGLKSALSGGDNKEA